MRAPYPWEVHGGSFVWRGERNPHGHASLPSHCCQDMRPNKIGSCGDGCCDDYECLNCGARWRYEWPD